VAFDESLAARIRKLMARRKGVREKRMFGVAFLFNGNLLVGVWKLSLIVSLGDEQGEAALKEPHVKVCFAPTK
jgi:hypothetical protein